MRYLISVILSSLVLTSCSHIYGESGMIRDRDKEYLQAKSIPTLKIPSNLNAYPIETHYPVAERSYAAENRVVDLTPPDLSSPPPPPRVTEKPAPVAAPISKQFSKQRAEAAPAAPVTSQEPESPLPGSPKQYYFDRYTRSETPGGRAVGSLFPAKTEAATPAPVKRAAPTGKISTAETAPEAPIEKDAPPAEESERKKPRYYYDRYSTR